MKKSILGLVISFICVSIVSAATIDKNSIEIRFEGFKAPQMLNLEGKFNEVKYTFKNDNTSIASTLRGATAIVKPSSLDTGVDAANKNLKEAFFKTLIGNGDVKVTIKDVMEGDNTGIIMAYVTMGSKKDVALPLTYTIKDNKLEAKGQLNLDLFNNSKKALEALSKAAPGHAGISWPLVNITFSANVIDSMGGNNM